MAYYLGIDLGTQSMKALLIDPEKNFVSEAIAVNYGKELPEYNSPAGFLPGNDPAVCCADPAMWLDALDLLMQKMVDAGWNMQQIAGISGSGQQHGSVYLNDSFPAILKSLDPGKKLSTQLAPAFSRKVSPIWMDASTGKECAMLSEYFGDRIRQITGSDPAERFTGPQIMKFARQEPDAYQKTSFIHLISSFFASVLAGENTAIDFGDGAGMNLADLDNGKWDESIVEFSAAGLSGKLPPLAPSTDKGGKLSAYFTKYGLKSGIPVNLWSGDNPNSLIGCGGYAPGTAVISLGTSDTFFGSISNFADAPAEHGHIFGNPAGKFMFLLCFANGSLTREALREKLNLSREEFEKAALAAEAGKYQLLPFMLPESTPAIAKPGMFYNFIPENVSDGEFIRALLESQMLTMKFHAGSRMKPELIRLTGGASASPLLRQLAADIFQTPVAVGESDEAAALGAAMRAANCAGGFSFAELTDKFCKAKTTIYPDTSKAGIYDAALAAFEKLYNEKLN
ncbi:MAG: carbohydrate kinase [Lentisphaeria bacterium]|nr:carbohydrate kinase [Lentisphaeria bacterium]